jgi:hypothetical protein
MMSRCSLGLLYRAEPLSMQANRLRFARYESETLRRSAQSVWDTLLTHKRTSA